VLVRLAVSAAGLVALFVVVEPSNVALMVGLVFVSLVFASSPVLLGWSPILRAVSSYLVRTTGQQWLLSIPTVLFCGFILWILANIAVRPIYGPVEYNGVVVGLSVLVATLLLPAMFRACSVAGTWLSERRTAHRWIILGCVFALILSGQILLMLAVLRFPGWDAGVLIDNVTELSAGENLSTDYYSRYPHNITLTMMIWRFSELCGLFGLHDVLLNAALFSVLALFVGIVLTYLCARKLAGEGTALFSLIPSIVLVGVSPWLATAYSDTVGLLFPIAIFYVFLLARERNLWWTTLICWIVLGLLAGLAYTVKPTAIVVLIAIALVVVVEQGIKKFASRAIVVPIAALVISLVAAGGMVQLVRDAQNRSDVVEFDMATNDRSFPPAHFLKMGARDLGGYNADDAAVTEALPTYEARSSAALAEYLQRVSDMGAVGYVGFLSDKALWSLGDGTFFQWGEGGAQDRPYVHSDQMSSSVQSYFDLNGTNHSFLVTTWQATWLVVLGLVEAGIFLRGRIVHSTAASVMRFALIGLLLYVMFFENRSRYLYLYVPFFIVLASCSMSEIARWLRAQSAPLDHSIPSLAGDMSSPVSERIS